MANAALFIGYGAVMPGGCARQALRVFNESLEYYGRVQKQGQIESFGAGVPGAARGRPHWVYPFAR